MQTKAGNILEGLMISLFSPELAAANPKATKLVDVAKERAQKGIDTIQDPESY